MKLAESVITQFRLHLQIDGGKIAYRQIAVIVHSHTSYIHDRVVTMYMHNFGEVRADSISVFGRFWSPRVFSAYYTPLSKSLRFLILSMPFFPFGTKRHGTGKNLAE